MKRDRRPSRSGRRYPREARLNELLREIIASELERIDDPDLVWVSVTEVRTDRDLSQALVFVDVLDEGHDAEVLDSLGRHRARLQRAIGQQARVRRTPPLRFEIDQTVRQAQRIEEILGGLDDGGGDAP